MPLAQRLIDELGRIPHLRVHGITQSDRNHLRVPTVSLTHTKHPSTVLARALAERGFNVWSGHNYALETARQLGLDEREGVLRIGLAHYNTEAEVQRVIAALRELLV
jgi:selenocysteine lyase/cysteine desulfurase